METQQVKLRDGAVDYGRIYKQKTAALLSIRCALNTDIDDFWVVSNVDGFAAFGDIILLAKFKDESKKMFCIQLKHIETKLLQVTRLESDTGNFSVERFYDNYKKIAKNISKIDLLKGMDLNQIYFILYINAALTDTNESVSLKLEIKPGPELIDTSANSDSIWQISSSNTHLEENFLQQFYIYANQASATAFDTLIKNEFHIHFNDVSNEVITNIVDYFLKWSAGRNGKIALISKKHVQTRLLEFLLTPNIIEPKQAVKRNDDILNLLNDTLIHFNVTPVSDEKSLENIFCSIEYTLEEICDIPLNFDLSWNSELTRELRQRLTSSERREKQQINNVLKEKQLFVVHLTIKDLYLCAWQCKLIPLIINCSDSLNYVQEVLVKLKDITEDLSFVLLNPSNIHYIKENLTVFSNLNDINDTNLLERNLERTSVSLQGKQCVKLNEFSSAILEEVTADVYTFLLNGTLQIGEMIETEDYYIKRYLRRSHLRLQLDVLDINNAAKEARPLQNQQGDLFLLTGFDGSIPVRYINHSMDLSEYVTQLLSCRTIDVQKYILTVALFHTDANVIEQAILLHDRTGKAVHVVRLGAQSLIWFFSKGSTESLQAYAIESIFEDESVPLVPEDSILQHFDSKINIISNNAGIGKTLMLKSIANKFDATKWVSYINLSEHFSKISKTNELHEFIEYFFEYQTTVNEKVVRNFCRKVYQTCWTENNIVWLLDGYDEVTSEQILWLLNQIKRQDINMWITTKPTNKRELEMFMDTSSLEITHFREEDRVMFLWKYFETHHDIYGYNQEQIQYIINTINKCSKNLDKTFIAIPLHTRMLAEIFGDDIDRISEKGRLNIIDLYNKFVDIKLKGYKSYEATSLKRTLCKLALKLFFTEEELDELFDLEELAEEALAFQESYKKDSIVIGLKDNGDAVFGHRTFAEFLAGHWLAKQIITKKGKYNTAWIPLVEKLFYVEMIQVRIFFDRILCQDMPLHLAVLNNDIDSIELLLKEETVVNKVDKLGRSPVHLAVSYGKYYDLHGSNEVKGLKREEIHSAIKESDDNYELKLLRMEERQFRVSPDIVEKLLDNGFRNTIDGLFQYDVFDYAIKSRSFEAASVLAIKLGNNWLPMNLEDHLFNHGPEEQLEEKNIQPLINFVASKGYSMYITTLVECGLNVNNIDDKGDTPLILASKNGYPNVIRELASNNCDLNLMKTNESVSSIQSWAQGNEHVSLSTKLCQMGTSNDRQRRGGVSALHFAARHGQAACVEELVQLGADKEIEDTLPGLGYSPLIWASMYGHSTVIETLLSAKNCENTPKFREDVEIAIIWATLLNYTQCVKILLEFAQESDQVEDSDRHQERIKTILSSEFVVHFSPAVRNFSEIKNVPMVLAAKNGSVQIIQELISKRYKNNIGLYVSLYWAAREGHVDCVKALVDLGADDIVKNEKKLLLLPIVWASMYGRTEVVRYFLSNKSREYSQDKDLRLALNWAALGRHYECVKMLLHFGLDVNDVDEELHENTPPIPACKNKGTGGVNDQLVSSKCIVNEHNPNTIHSAAKKNNFDFAKRPACTGPFENFDIDENSDLYKNLQQALIWAIRKEENELIYRLIELGIKVGEDSNYD